MQSFSFVANTFQEVANEVVKITGLRFGDGKERTDDEWLEWINEQCGYTREDLSYTNFVSKRGNNHYRVIAKKKGNKYFVNGTAKEYFAGECKECGKTLYFCVDTVLKNKESFICDECKERHGR